MNRKELLAEFKERTVPMGVWAIHDRATGRVVRGTSLNLDATWNRAVFQLNLGTYPDAELQAAWKTRGPDAFGYEVVQVLAPRKDGTTAEYREELEELLLLCSETRHG